MVTMNRRSGWIALIVLLTACPQLCFAQGLSLSQRLSALEVAVFNKDFSQKTAVWRIEHLEKSFPEASQQKKKDLPTRIQELAQRIQPPQNVLGGAAPRDYGSDQYNSRDAYDKQSYSRDPIGQAAAVPKSLIRGTKRMIGPLMDFSDESSQMSNMATRPHKFSGATEEWSQDSNMMDWYRPSNMRGFTPYYVDGSAKNDTGAYGRPFATPRRSAYPQYSPYPRNSQFPQQLQDRYADEMDEDM
jgi:hypothetical protein